MRVSAYHRSYNESKTFTLRYRVLGAIKRWDDIGELYWKFIGDKWDLGASDIAIGITLPNPGVKIVPEENVRAWAHGPITGTVHFAVDAPGAPVAGDVILEAPEIPALTFVEARILFPREWLTAAADTPGARLQEALDEEDEWAKEFNARRVRAKILIGLARWGTVLLSLAALFFAWRQFEQHGREHKPQFQGEYFREEPAELHPAIVGALWRMGSVKDSDMSVSIMNLANEGVVSMKPVTVEKKGFLGIGGGTETDWALTVDRARLESAHAIDKQLAGVLFDQIGRGDGVTISRIKAYAKSNPETFSQSMSAWKSFASSEAAQLGFIEAGGQMRQGCLFVVAVLLAIVAVVSAVYTETWWLAVFGVIVAVVIGVMAAFGARRSREGTELYAKYLGVRNYLRDFSRLNEAPPTHVTLWNHFLVLAVVFGIAEQVIEAMRVKIPEVVQDPGFAMTYWWLYSGGSYSNSPISALDSGFASAASIASSEMASSSGGGGGFSGGGGGGGGGGGAD